MWRVSFILQCAVSENSPGPAARSPRAARRRGLRIACRRRARGCGSKARPGAAAARLVACSSSLVADSQAMPLPGASASRPGAPHPAARSETRPQTLLLLGQLTSSWVGEQRVAVTVHCGRDSEATELPERAAWKRLPGLQAADRSRATCWEASPSGNVPSHVVGKPLCTRCSPSQCRAVRQHRTAASAQE
jgi:hypothetical protein